MRRAEFEEVVRRAVEALPEEFVARLDNVAIVVEDRPTRDQLFGGGLDEWETLLGLYEGQPLTSREDYGLVPPDKITIFHRPIEAICENVDQIFDEVQATVVHEIAHHFGIDDHSLEEMGRG